MALIVDAQIHVWRQVEPGWTAHREGRFDAAVVLPLMKEAGVAGAVLVPTAWELDPNQVSIEAAREHPDRFVVMGLIDSLDGLDERLAGWQDEGMLGVRLPLRQEPYGTWALSGELERFWAAAERVGMRVFAFGAGLKIDAVAAGARRHPGVPIVLDHMGLSPFGRPMDLTREESIERVVALAGLPNVAVKVSSLPVFSSEGYPYRDLFEPIRRVVDAFGPERSFWGSDMSRQPCSYDETISMMGEALPDLAAAERDLLMGTALTRWLGWTPADL